MKRRAEARALRLEQVAKVNEKVREKPQIHDNGAFTLMCVNFKQQSKQSKNSVNVNRRFSRSSSSFVATSSSHNSWASTFCFITHEPFDHLKTEFIIFAQNFTLLHCFCKLNTRGDKCLSVLRFLPKNRITAPHNWREFQT